MDERAKIRVVGVSYDAKSSYLGGAAQAPGRIREEILSTAYNPYAESVRNVVDSALSWGPILRPGSYQEIFSMAAAILAEGERCVFIGGDHSISYPLIQAVHRHFGRFHVLHFDAHGDLYDQLDNDRFSHACPFARIMESGLVESLTQVGIRTMTPHQVEQAKRFNVRVITMQDLAGFDPASLPGPLYLSVDIDALDPAFAPGVSHREPGGLDPVTLIRWIQSLSQPVIGADLVEYNPLQDCRGITATLCYKLIKELVDTMTQVSG